MENVIKLVSLKKSLKFGISAIFVLGMYQFGFGQYNDYYSDPYSDGDDYYSSEDSYGSDSSDSSSYDDYGYGSGNDDYSSDYGFGNSGGGGGGGSDHIVAKKIERPEYTRFIPPYDSVRQLIIYKEVVEVKDQFGDEHDIDTINFRTHKWMEEEFGKQLKTVVKMDGINDNPDLSDEEHKIVIHSSFPCVIKPNEHAEVVSGVIEYDMEIRIRYGKYRCTFLNLVHVADVKPGEKEGERTYFEYLMKAKQNVKQSDRYMIAADRTIHEMMEELKKVCQQNPIPEEDEW
ncbi:MAG: hypothetical protein H6607_08400 [Flavobacteriales bacterium]|nr:hypothetical protein [Flavobacteriales bacterium]